MVSTGNVRKTILLFSTQDHENDNSVMYNITYYVIYFCCRYQIESVTSRSERGSERIYY